MPISNPTSPGHTDTTVDLACAAPTGLPTPVSVQYVRVPGSAAFTPGPDPVTPDDGSDGAFSPSGLTFGVGSNPAAQTQTYAPASAGTKSITLVDGQGLTVTSPFTYIAYTALVAPTLHPASAITSASVLLTWGAASGGAAPVTYLPQYKLSIDTAWTDGEDAGTAQSATVSGLQPNTAEDFRIKATDAVGNVVYSNTVSATTRPAGLCLITVRARNGSGALAAGCQVKAAIPAGFLPDTTSDALLTGQVVEGETGDDGAISLYLVQGHTYTVRCTDPDLRVFLWRDVLVPETDSASLWELI